MVAESTFSNLEGSESSLDNRYNLTKTLTKLFDQGDCLWNNSYPSCDYNKRARSWL